MKNLENYLLISMPDDQAIESSKVLQVSLIKASDHFAHTHNFLAESLRSIADNLQALPPESVMEIIDPLQDLIRSAGIALGKVF